MAAFACIRLLGCCAIAAFASTVHADARVERNLSAQAPSAAPVQRLNTVALISEAIAALLGADAQRVLLAGVERHASMFATRREIPRTEELRVPFASRHERDTVSLMLAESEVRVRLTQDVQLRWELSSQEVVNADPELRLGFGVQFKFK